MPRQKAAKNEMRDYVQSSVYGIVSLSCGLWLLNNYQDTNPYVSVVVSAAGIEAFRRWSLVREVGSKMNSAGTTGQRLMASSVQTIFSTKKPEPLLDPDVLTVPYRKTGQNVRVHKETLSVFLQEGFNRQLQKQPSPFSMSKFTHAPPKTIWCCWAVVGLCGQFDTFGQGTSPLLITRPTRAIGRISRIWPRLIAS